MPSEKTDEHKVDQAVLDSFPASDPTSHSKDVGPDRLANFDAIAVAPNTPHTLAASSLDLRSAVLGAAVGIVAGAAIVLVARAAYDAR